MRAVLFHNPAAGERQPPAEDLIEALRLAGLSVSYCSTKEEDLEKALACPAEFVVVAGGDGTVAKVVTRLRDRTVPIAIVPLGTANNVARTLGIDGTIDEIVSNWRTGSERRLDIGVAEGSWGKSRFLESVGLGVLAEATAKKSDRKKEENKKANGRAESGRGGDKLKHGRDAVSKALRKAKPIVVEMTVDDRRIEEEILFLEIMNTRLVGPGLCLVPYADPGDGILDLAFVSAARREEMLAWLEDCELPPPVSFDAGRRIVVAPVKARLRVGDQFPAGLKGGELKVEIEETAAVVLVPSAVTQMSEPVAEGAVA